MSPIKILFVEANPPDSPHIRTTPELRDLQRVLKEARSGADFEVIPMLAARGGDLLHALSEHQPHILHFAVHGDGDGLLLNRPGDAESETLRAEDLLAIVRTHQDAATQRLHLVVMLNCYTAHLAELLAGVVDAAVGMEDDIDDLLVQQVITPLLYRRLADGAKLGNALAAVDLELRRQGRVDAAEMVRLYPETGGAVNPLTWRRRLLSPAMLDYLRSWFDKPWASVPLAEILGLADDDGARIELLDVYVPLKVDFTIVVKTEQGRIVDWWAKTAQEETLEREAALRELRADLSEMAELRPRLRTWPALGADEQGLQGIVDGIQQKIVERISEGREGYGDDEHNWYMEAHDAASVQARFVLLGEPGSGKSSFLRHLTLCLAGELCRRSGDAATPANASLAALRDWLLDAYAPVYIEMRELVATVFPALPEDDDASVKLPDADHFWRYLTTLFGAGLAGPGGELRAWFDRGEAHVLFDGLDEVPQADRTGRRQQIKALIAALLRRYPNLRIIVAGRPHAYRAGEWTLDGFGLAELRSLNMQRLHELASALFPAALGEAGKDQADAFIAAIREQLNTKRIEESFYANPLFFTLLAGLWLDPAARAQLPTTRAELYRRSVDLLLTRWTRRRLPDSSVAENLGLDATGLRSVLETLACTVHEQSAPGQDTTRFGVGELLAVLYRARCRVQVLDVPDYLARHVGLLTSPATEDFYFTHRSFQEHLAACELICAAPDAHLPPVAHDRRRFPHGLVHRTTAQPALWGNVARLAADELLAHDRARDAGRTLAELCRPYLDDRRAAEAAYLTLEIATEHNLFARNLDELDLRHKDFTVLHQAALAALLDHTSFTPQQRLLAGNLLAARPGLDTRPGVDVKHGVPDLAWCEVPEFSPEGKREFLHHDGTRNTPHEGLPTFWIAKYPITYVQFQAFVDAPDGYRNPEWRKGLADYFGKDGTRWPQNWPLANRPRERVTWPEAVAFCRWLTAQAALHPELLPDDVARAMLAQGGSIRLPTEQEWVKAARGFDDRLYPWGGQAYQVGYANVDETEDKTGPHNLQETSAVGMYPHAASPFGVEEMSGNVWEYCLNKYYDPDDKELGGRDYRAVRGGSWYYNSERSSVAARVGVFGGNLVNGYGFRVVCAASP